MSRKKGNLHFETEKQDNGCNPNTNLLIMENSDHEKEVNDIENIRNSRKNKFRKGPNDALLKRKPSWKWIDGPENQVDLSSEEGCCKWIKRFLTIGNIGVIIVCGCLLLASSIVCFKK